MNIAKFCIRHKVTTLLAVIMIAVFGVVYTTQLQMALLPNIEYPAAYVYCYYNGAGPEDIEQLVTRPLERIDGVASVSVSGGVERQITVTLDAQRAAGYGLSTSYITQILQAENLLYPAGEVYNGSQKISVTTDAQLKAAQTMGNILSRAV